MCVWPQAEGCSSSILGSPDLPAPCRGTWLCKPLLQGSRLQPWGHPVVYLPVHAFSLNILCRCCCSGYCVFQDGGAAGCMSLCWLCSGTGGFQGHRGSLLLLAKAVLLFVKTWVTSARRAPAARLCGVQCVQRNPQRLAASQPSRCSAHGWCGVVAVAKLVLCMIFLVCWRSSPLCGHIGCTATCAVEFVQHLHAPFVAGDDYSLLPLLMLHHRT